jgi:hypothetical protein
VRARVLKRGSEFRKGLEKCEVRVPTKCHESAAGLSSIFDRLIGGHSCVLEMLHGIVG